MVSVQRATAAAGRRRDVAQTARRRVDYVRSRSGGDASQSAETDRPVERGASGCRVVDRSRLRLERSKRHRWCSTACCTAPRRGARHTRLICARARLKWTWDPGLVRAGYEADGPRACCGPVNRGVALYKGRVYIGLLDGRLVALNAQTGLPEWAVQTTPPGTDYTITGAPRVIKGRVVIGQGGAEFGVRGFLAGYDAETGKLAWKFYVVPGDPAKPFEDEALARAAKTWNGQWWKSGGGGTPWDGIAYDPELNLIYVGHRQRIAVERAASQSRRRRQPVSVVDRRAQRRHRQVRLALPDVARRQLGLQRRAADDPRGHSLRQPDAQGDHAGAEERLLLRARSRGRQD